MPPFADGEVAADTERLAAEALDPKVLDAFLALDADVQAAYRALLDEDVGRALDARLADIRRSAN